MIELIALVGNHQVWIHSASLLFALFHAAEELFFLHQSLYNLRLSLEVLRQLYSSVFMYRPSLHSLYRSIPQAIAEGVSPHGDAATLPGVYAPSQPALCLEMKAEAMEKHFLSCLCSVLGCGRSGRSTRGSPGCGVGVRH